MANVRVHEIIDAFYGANVIDDEEFLLLHEINRPRNPRFPYERYNFNFEEMTEDECWAEFRFKKVDIPQLLQVFQLPNPLRCYNGVVADPLEGLCICLRRLAYPCRYGDLIPRFGRPVPQLSMLCNIVIDHIFHQFGHLLSSFDQQWLSRENLKVFADAIHQKGAALDNCWGFIDGTVRPICRPKRNQRVVYNGHKRVHALKYQSVVAPNGLIAHLYGPVEGRRHDSGMLAMSGLLPQLEQHSFSPDGQVLCIYGDLAYPHRLHLQCPFPAARLTQEQQAFNESMSSSRVSVEWVFGDIINYYKFMDFKKNLKIGLSSVGKTYSVCALLRNARTCLYGCSTAKYFRLEPPSLVNYFA